ncbi:hypothetical protein DW095_10165 [Bacteroides sp. AM07-16]|nr:hypothetical protein DW095_10165 [Bacteroides sp. AM07-16]
MICKAKLKVYDTNMTFFNRWGNIYINKETYLDEDSIRDIKIFKDNMYISTFSGLINCYNSETGVLKHQYKFSDKMIDFDIDTLNMNLLVLNTNNLSIFDRNASLIRLINIEKPELFSKCLYVDNKILLISKALPNCNYLLLDTIDVKNKTITTNYNAKSNYNLEIPSFCIGNEHNSYLYKNILNDTIYRFENCQFKPYIKSSIGKYKIIRKKNGKFKENAQFRILNIWHINNYWLIQYRYKLAFHKKIFDWEGLAVLDNELKILETDIDSYIKGQSIYLDSKLDIYVDKENSTLYQVYKKTDSKMYVNESDTELSEKICINYFKVK